MEKIPERAEATVVLVGMHHTDHTGANTSNKENSGRVFCMASCISLYL